MQPLPANGQAQPLPGKWVIKRTPANAEMVNKWANDNDDVAFNYHEDNGYIHSEAVYKVGLPISFFHPKPLPSFTLITDSQFKAMVEGERPKPTYKLGARYIVRWEYYGEGHEAEAVYNYHPVRKENVFFTEEGHSYLFENQISEATLTLTQPNPDLSTEGKVIAAYDALIACGEHEAAAALKAKRTDIWPVDWEKEIVRRAIIWHDAEIVDATERGEEVLEAVRNYLQSKIEG